MVLSSTILVSGMIQNTSMGFQNSQKQGDLYNDEMMKREIERKNMRMRKRK